MGHTEGVLMPSKKKKKRVIIIPVEKRVPQYDSRVLFLCSIVWDGVSNLLMSSTMRILGSQYPSTNQCRRVCVVVVIDTSKRAGTLRCVLYDDVYLVLY